MIDVNFNHKINIGINLDYFSIIYGQNWITTKFKNKIATFCNNQRTILNSFSIIT